MASSTAAMSCPKIMKRPSSASTNQGAVSVCGITAAATATKEKKKTAVLQNKGAFRPAAVMMLAKEEKKDDHGVMTMRPDGQAGTAMDDNAAPKKEASKTSEPASSQDDAAACHMGSNTAWDPLEEVDSALLSALCDTRERKALYRLEQVILDFMKDKSSGFMEVGGAFNSIVLGQHCQAASNNGETPEAQAFSNQGLLDLQYQQQRGLRQTSFQRLILHRLADRFDILREQITTATNPGSNEGGLVDVGANHSGQPPSFSPGLIRLVKKSESLIPPHLLIDINLDLLIDYKNPRARNFGGGTTTATIPHAPSNNYDDGAKNLSENMASTTLEAPVSASGNKKSKKKMVIMKRNISSDSRGGVGGKGKGKQTGASRRKKLEDREKAYEEARARIFGGAHGVSGNDNNDGSDENTEKGERSSVPQRVDPQDNAMASLHSCPSSVSAQDDAIAPTGAVSREHLVPSQVMSAIPTTDHSSSPSPEPQGEGDQRPASPPGAGAPECSAVPAAVTSGAIFKAVYRNRQQEENDPDFKRTSDVRPAYAPYAANPYGAPVGYVNPATGQPMQLQQAHQSHFYPGLHTTTQVPIPQDAAAYASTTQWPPTPSRAYYPPHQPEGQKEKHQAWQPHAQNNSATQVPPHTAASSNSGNIHGATSHSQPKQPTTVLWGPGTQGYGGEPEKAISRTPEGVPSTEREEKAALYMREDFPALT